MAAAAVILVALLGGFTWTERIFLFRGASAIGASAGPGRWLGLALALCAFLVVAAGPLGAFEPKKRPRRTLWSRRCSRSASSSGRASSCAGSPTSPLPCPIRRLEGQDPARLAPYGRAARAGPGGDPGRPEAAGSTQHGGAGARARRSAHDPGRRGAVQTWRRPQLPADYAQSAFADLEAGTFIAAAGLLLAVIASLGARRRRGWDSNPRGT